MSAVIVDPIRRTAPEAKLNMFKSLKYVSETETFRIQSFIVGKALRAVREICATLDPCRRFKLLIVWRENHDFRDLDWEDSVSSVQHVEGSFFFSALNARVACEAHQAVLRKMFH